jgi:predicted Zn-dependent peptidase
MVFVARDGAVQSELRLGHAGPSRSTPDYHALLVLNMVLGGQFVSRVNQNLREAKGYTYGASTAFDWCRGRGPFRLHTSVQTAATVDALREAVREVSEIRASRPPSEAELEVARAALTRGFPRSLETASQLARAGVQIALHGLPADAYAQFPRRVAAVSAADVRRAAEQHLDPGRLVAVVVGSRPDVLEGLATLGFGEPVEREAR